MRRLLLRAAKGLARGEQPPALGGGDFRSIRGAEKVLADGEDWRVLGTDDDPIVRERFPHDRSSEDGILGGSQTEGIR
jgi:phthalate 4,5-dioxygenase